MPQEKSDRLSPGRLEAFSDGVIAVIITIMVLEIHVPGKEIANPAALRLALPLVLVYLLSFIQTGIYWVNHHYLVDDLDQVTHGILWSNLALLFALSLIPAATEWVAVRGISSYSIALYAAICAFPGAPWMVLSTLIQRRSDSPPASGIVKQAASICLYLGAIPLAFVSPRISIGMIVIVAVLWLLPPRKIVNLTRDSISGKRDEITPS
ncbi:MAG: TMEM175 family protein [Acidobacteriaceae bacterium]